MEPITVSKHLIKTKFCCQKVNEGAALSDILSQPIYTDTDR
jgi:hypothetical protein